MARSDTRRSHTCYPCGDMTAEYDKVRHKEKLHLLHLRSHDCKVRQGQTQGEVTLVTLVVTWLQSTEWSDTRESHSGHTRGNIPAEYGKVRHKEKSHLLHLWSHDCRVWVTHNEVRHIVKSHLWWHECRVWQVQTQEEVTIVTLMVTWMQSTPRSDNRGSNTRTFFIVLC